MLTRVESRKAVARLRWYTRQAWVESRTRQRQSLRAALAQKVSRPEVKSGRLLSL